MQPSPHPRLAVDRVGERDHLAPPRRGRARGCARPPSFRSRSRRIRWSRPPAEPYSARDPPDVPSPISPPQPTRLHRGCSACRDASRALIVQAGAARSALASPTPTDGTCNSPHSTSSPLLNTASSAGTPAGCRARVGIGPSPPANSINSTPASPACGERRRRPSKPSSPPSSPSVATALASHRSAAYLWGIARPDDDPIDVIVTGRRRLPSLDGVIVHRPKDLRRLIPQRRSGIRCTNVLRTVLDLGAVDHQRSATPSATLWPPACAVSARSNAP